jgi:hypothetical protein
MLLDTNIVSTFLKRDAQKRTPRLYNFVKAQLSAEGLAIALPAGCRRVLAGCRRRAATGQDGREDRCPIRPMAQTHWLSPIRPMKGSAIVICSRSRSISIHVPTSSPRCY